MKLIENQGSAHLKIEATHSKIAHHFEIGGKIGIIVLVCKSNSFGNTMKMEIGNTIFTDDELINENSAWQLPNEIRFNFINHLAFKKGDVFKFEQISDNVSEIHLWLSESEKPDAFSLHGIKANQYRVKFTNPTKGVLSGILFGNNIFESVDKFGSAHSIDVEPAYNVSYKQLLNESKLQPFKVVNTIVNSSNMNQCMQNIYHKKNHLSVGYPLYMTPKVKMLDDNTFSSNNTDEYIIDGDGFLELVIMPNTTVEVVVTTEPINQ